MRIAFDQVNLIKSDTLKRSTGRFAADAVCVGQDKLRLRQVADGGLSKCSQNLDPLVIAVSRAQRVQHGDMGAPGHADRGGRGVDLAHGQAMAGHGVKVGEIGEGLLVVAAGPFGQGHDAGLAGFGRSRRVEGTVGKRADHAMIERGLDVFVNLCPHES